jgi:hypothetical protein
MVFIPHIIEINWALNIQASEIVDMIIIVHDVTNMWWVKDWSISLELQHHIIYAPIEKRRRFIAFLS